MRIFIRSCVHVVTIQNFIPSEASFIRDQDSCEKVWVRRILLQLPLGERSSMLRIRWLQTLNRLYSIGLQLMFGYNDWRSPHRTLGSTASILKSLRLKFLTEELPQLLKDVPVTTRQTMWFVHDEAPSHFTRDVEQFLDSHCPYRWTGQNGLVLWPPRSLDLTPACGAI
jgi:hypothetical protein